MALELNTKDTSLRPGDQRRTTDGYLLEYRLQEDGTFELEVIEHPESQQKLDVGEEE